MYLQRLKQYSAWSPLAIRVLAGIIFIMTGYMKLSNIAGTTAQFIKWGIPLAGVAVWIVGIVELLGGIALIIGIGTRCAALLLGIVMLVASIVMISLNGLPGAMTPLFGFAAMFSVLFTGAGALSVEKRFCKNKDAATKATK